MSSSNANDLVAWIEKSIDEFCRVHTQTGENHICDSLIAVLERRHVKKMERLKSPIKGLSSWGEPSDSQLDELVGEVLKNKEFKQPVEPKQVNTEILELEWNDKGPIVDSYIAIDLINQIFEKSTPNQFEVEFLNGKLQKATEYPQVFFTFSSGRIFEKLCYRAKIKCPFHIYAGQNTPPDNNV